MVNKLIKNFLSVLTFIIISILIVIRLFISVTQPYGGEGINHSFIHYRINIFAIIFIIILIIVINKAKVKNLNDQTKSFLCFIIPFLFGIFFMIFYNDKPIRDAKACLNAADLLINNGIRSVFQSAYFTKSPYQIGFVLYLALFKLVFGSFSVTAIQLFQITLFSIANTALFKISSMITKRDIIKPFLLLSFLWIIPIEFNLYIYGISLGLSLAIFSIYYTFKYIDSDKTKDFMLSLLFVSVATFIKPNFLILFITYLLFYIFIYKNTILKKVILSIIVAIVLLFSNNSYAMVSKLAFNYDIPKGLPKTSWLAMASLDNPHENHSIYALYTPGFYNGYIDDRTETSEQAYEIYLNQDIDQLAHSLELGLDNPHLALKFYYYKTAFTWAFNDFFVISELFNYDQEQPTFIKFNKSRFGESLIDFFISGTLLVIFIGALCFLLSNDYDSKALILIIYFIGGFLFHLIFETRPSYVYPYISALIPLAVIGIDINQEKMYHTLSNYKFILIGVIALSVGVNYFINVYENFEKESYYNFETGAQLIDSNIFLQFEFNTNNVNNPIDSFEIYATGDLKNTPLIAHIESSNIDAYIKNDAVINNDNAHYRFDLSNLSIQQNASYKVTLFLDKDRYNTQNASEVIIPYGNSDSPTYIKINDKQLDNTTINFKLITKSHSNGLIIDSRAKKSIPLIWYNEALSFK